jgi:uncharacterized protein with PQ loop repeat
MNSAAMLGTCGTVIGLVRALPQLVRLVRAREAHGVSVDSTATSSIVSLGWATYGVLTHQPYVSLATGASGLVFAASTFAALRFGREIRELRIAPVWLGALVLAGAVGGKSGLGFALPISVLAANLPQAWVASRERDLADLSLGTWLLSTADGLVWGAYSLVQHDTTIGVFALFQVTTSGFIAATKVWRRPAPANPALEKNRGGASRSE